MQAVILAAGEGRRLRPLTENYPKPMIRVGGKPILEHTLGILPQEVDEVILVIGYKGEKIKDYFGSEFGRLSLKYAFQPEPKGTADALLKAEPLLKGENFLLLYADDLYHPDDLESVIGELPSVLIKESNEPERFGVCLLDQNGRLREVLEKKENPPSNLVNIGVYLLNREIFSVPPVFTPNGEVNLAAQIGAWAKTRPVRVVKARFWHPIGYPSDLDKAEDYFRLPFSEWLN